MRDRIPLIGQRHAGGRGHCLAGPMRCMAWRLSERRLDRAVDKRAGGDGRRPAFFVVTQQAGDTFTYEPRSTAPYGVAKPMPDQFQPAATLRRPEMNHARRCGLFGSRH